MTTPIRHEAITFDDTTKEGRYAHWLAWNMVSPELRGRIGTPPCYTCGAPPVGTYRDDGSPRFDCHLVGRHGTP